MNKNQRLVRSVLRALDVLSVVCEVPEGMTLKELASAAGMKPPALHKVLQTLVARGFLERTERPVRYRRGPAVRMLAENEQGFLTAAQGVLRDLAKRFPGAVLTLSRMVHDDVVVVLRISPERPGFVDRPAGHTLASYGSASGAAFQAWMAAEDLAVYRLRHPFRDEGQHLWGTESAFDQFLGAVRSRGCSVPRFSPRGGRSWAAPVFNVQGRVHAVIGASLPPGRGESPANGLERALKHAAAALSGCRSRGDPGITAVTGKRRRREK